MKLILAKPTSELSYNKTKSHHWSRHYTLRTSAKETGWKLALEWCTKHGFWTDKDVLKGEWELIIRVFNKNKVRLDDDNLTSALKPCRDGIFEYLGDKFGMNDKQVTLTILDTAGIDKLNPRVEWNLAPRIRYDN